MKLVRAVSADTSNKATTIKDTTYARNEHAEVTQYVWAIEDLKKKNLKSIFEEDQSLTVAFHFFHSQLLTFEFYSHEDYLLPSLYLVYL